MNLGPTWGMRVRTLIAFGGERAHTTAGIFSSNDACGHTPPRALALRVANLQYRRRCLGTANRVTTAGGNHCARHSSLR